MGRMPELTVSGTIGRGSINLALRVVDLSLQSHFTVHTVNTKLSHVASVFDYGSEILKVCMALLSETPSSAADTSRAPHDSLDHIQAVGTAATCPFTAQ
jgi:hypothetical protein